MEGWRSQLSHLKALLSDYAVSTGLKVKYSKSMLVPINMDENRTNFLAQPFVVVGTLPFTYLGIPLVLTKPKIEKTFMERGNVNAKNPPKADWEMVCLPKSELGLLSS